METNTNPEIPETKERIALLERIRLAAECSLSILSFLAVAGFLVSPVATLRVIGTISAAGSFFIPKMILAALFVRHHKLVFRGVLRFYRFLRSRSREEHLEERIEGVPKSELIHFLFDTGAFKLDDFRKRFGVHRRHHERIARRLEKLGILTRGENNSRILATNEDGSPSFSMQEVKAAIDDAEIAEDISLFQVAGNVRTSERIKSDLANPLFTTKAIR